MYRVDISGNVAVGDGVRQDASSQFEVNGASNVMMIFSRNASSNSSRLFFNTNGVYNWNVGMLSSSLDFTFTDEINNKQRITIKPGSANGGITIDGSTGNTVVIGTVTASPATVSTELVTKGQLDAAVSNIRTTSINDSVLISDFTILVDTSGGNRIITFDPVTLPSKLVNIKKITNDVNTVTILPASGTIDSFPSIVFNTFNQSIPVHSNGTNLYTL